MVGKCRLLKQVDVGMGRNDWFVVVGVCQIGFRKGWCSTAEVGMEIRSALLGSGGISACAFCI